jgi:hypothetical protein
MASMASSIKGCLNRLAYGAAKATVIELMAAIAADITPQVTYLLSDESRYATGQVILPGGDVTM